MGILTSAGVEAIYHFAPLHYLPFIARSRSLLSKPSLKKAGFADSHLRSMSSRQDIARGFGSYTHLTLTKEPPILKAKLDAGFPHIGIRVEAALVDDVQYSLCRFNVAMTRYLRRDGKPGFAESAVNGRYYAGHQIPTARNPSDKKAMLTEFAGTSTMIEVLVHGDLPLSEQAQVICYSKEDAKAANQILHDIGVKWQVLSEPSPGPYLEHAGYRAKVDEFIVSAMADPDWRGNGLEFDRV